LGAGRPLYRALLVRLGAEAGYCLLQSYHHGAGDGTTGMLGLAAILQRYTALLTDSGTAPPPATPRPPRPPVEQLTQQPDGGAVLPRLLVEKEERARSYLPRLPFDLGELERCRAEQLPCNSSLWREGSEACYSAVRTRCRQEGVTVGSLALAACYLAQAVVHCRATHHTPATYPGLQDTLVDIPVNARRQVSPVIGDEYAGLYITELTSVASVTADTGLWQLARVLATQLHHRMQAGEHLAFSQAKHQFETDQRTAEVAASVPAHQVVDMLFSNKRFLCGPLKFDWGRVRACHSLGSFWTPGFANYLLLFQATDIFTYNLVHCPGKRNRGTAENLLDTFHIIMESSAGAGEQYGFRDIFSSMEE